MKMQPMEHKSAEAFAALVGFSEEFKQWHRACATRREALRLRYVVQWIVGKSGVGVHSIEARTRGEGRVGLFIVNEADHTFTAHCTLAAVSA